MEKAIALINGTGYPLDGIEAIVARKTNWYLDTWAKKDSEAVMQTYWLKEMEAGISEHATLEEYRDAWKNRRHKSDGLPLFIIPQKCVTVYEWLEW